MEARFDEMLYINSINKHLTTIVASNLLNVSPYRLTDKEVLEFIQNRTANGMTAEQNIEKLNNYCTFLDVDSIQMREYMGKEYNVSILKGNGNSNLHLEINNSNFRYASYPAIPTDNSFSQTYLDYPISSTIDKIQRVPIVGEKLLFMYCFESVTRFGNRSTCYRFSTLASNIDILRNAIIETQWFLLKYLTNFTKLFTIPTVIFYGSNRSIGVIDTVKSCFQNYFNREYKEYFLDLLDKVENEMKIHNITCPDHIWCSTKFR